VIITTVRIRRTLVNKINLLVDSPRSIEASCLAPVKVESIFLRHASGCFGTSCGLSCDSSSTTPPRTTRHRLLRLRRASGCLGTWRSSSRGLSRRSSSTYSPTPHVRVPRHVARLVTRLVVDYFTYVARPDASARRVARHAARRRLLQLRRAYGCLGMSRGSSRCLSHRSSSTTSFMPHVRYLRHVAWLVA
jgi:hypothetical protein